MGGEADPPLSQDYLLLSLLGVPTTRVAASAPPRAWDYLVVRDRVQLPLVSRTVRRHLREIEYAHCKDGALYPVPFPGFPGLFRRDRTTGLATDEEEDGAGLFPHQLASLQAMHRAENSNPHFGALRGGILADAPGLGKTITMLALITSTAGQRPRSPPEFWNSEQIAEAWRALSQHNGYYRDMMKVIKPFRPYYMLYPRLKEHVLPPFPQDRFPTIRDFELYVKRTMRPYATNAELELFRQNLTNFKSGMDKSNRKFLKSEAGRRLQWERSLVPTGATLLVVPDALLEHWFQQIHQHMDRSLFADANEDAAASDTEQIDNIQNANARGVVYLDGVGDLADARMPLGTVSLRAVPPTWELSKYMIVVTTFSRCDQEYRTEVSAGRMTRTSGFAGRGSRKRKSIDGAGGEETVINNNCSSFLQMRWLRIVVDEGHELGTHESGTGVTRFIHQIAAGTSAGRELLKYHSQHLALFWVKDL